MYDSTGGQYQPQFSGVPYYAVAQEERRQIRHTSNQVCWTGLAGIMLMYLLTKLCIVYLKALGLGFNASYSSFGGMPPVVYYLLISVEYSVGLALPAFAYFLFKRMPLSVGLPFHKADFRIVAAFVFFGCMVCMLANYPANWVSEIQKYFGFSGTIPEMPLNDDPRVLLLYGVNVVVIPPLVEEIMFRGVILQSLRRYGDGFAVVASAILFGMYHGNFTQMVFAFICGLAMAFAVVRTNSLLPSIIIHILNNGISLAVEMTSRYRGEAAASSLDGTITCVFLALGIAALFYLIVKKQVQRRNGGRSVLPLSAKIGALFSNFGAVVFVIYTLVSSISVMKGMS